MSSYSHTHGRPSMSSIHSESPSDSTKSHGSHRHVGEGALDDSDSSDSDHAQDGDSESNSDEETGLKPLISPFTAGRVIPATPSPLSHVAGQQQWTEDEADDKEDDEASPSPGSTDTESSSSDGGSSSRKKTRPGASRRNSLIKVKTRSRSSTVASLAVSTLLQARKPPLIKHESHGSIRTVLAGESSIGELDARDETSMDVRGRNGSTVSADTQTRQRSKALSTEHILHTPELGEDESSVPPPQKKMSEIRKLRIIDEEERLRAIGWDTLREALERFADQGDVQICAMLSVVASKELGVDKRRVSRFLESYAGKFYLSTFWEAQLMLGRVTQSTSTLYLCSLRAQALRIGRHSSNYTS